MKATYSSSPSPISARWPASAASTIAGIAHAAASMAGASGCSHRCGTRIGSRAMPSSIARTAGCGADPYLSQAHGDPRSGSWPPINFAPGERDGAQQDAVAGRSSPLRRDELRAAAGQERHRLPAHVGAREDAVPAGRIEAPQAADPGGSLCGVSASSPPAAASASVLSLLTSRSPMPSCISTRRGATPAKRLEPPAAGEVERVGRDRAPAGRARACAGGRSRTPDRRTSSRPARPAPR